MKKKKKIEDNFENISDQWKVHTPNLLGDIIVNLSSSNNIGAIYQPINIFRKMLVELSEVAREIDDPRLHLMMCKLTLYENSDVSSKEYDPNIMAKLRKSISEMNK